MRARTIKPDFFTDEELAECDPLARLLFAGLWCLADRDGKLHDRPRQIKAKLLPYEAGHDCDDLLAQLDRKRLIVRYEAGGERYVKIPGFTKHQNPHPKEKASEIPEPCNSAAESDLSAAGSGISETDPAGSSSSNPSVSCLRGHDEPAAAAEPVLLPTLPPKPVSPLVAFLRASFPDIKDPWACEDAWTKAFPAVDLLAESMRALAWETADPKRRKTNHGRFLNSWFGRAQDDASKRPQTPPRRTMGEPGKGSDFDEQPMWGRKHADHS